MLRFWISLNVLHALLRRLDAHIIYLNDRTLCMYLNGLASVGPDYNSMLAMLRNELRTLESSEVYVLASSSGGFVGLRAAMDLEAESFAGMSIRTKLERSPDRLTPGAQRLLERCRDPGMFVDLKDLLASSEYPRSVQLYCGELHQRDRMQAERLESIPRTQIHLLPGYRLHNPISGLIARGEFHQMLRRFMGEALVPVGVDTRSPG
jgi:hypothetical protein